MKINNRQLTFAREYRSISQTELARRIKGLSQSNLSKFEKGIDSLSDDILIDIIDELNFPKGFFDKKISNEVENAHYRKRSTMLKSDRSKIEYGNRLIGYIIDQLSDSIEWPISQLPTLDLGDGFTPEKCAQFVRKRFQIHAGDPIVNVNYFLEKAGIIVVEFESHDKFDGVSFLSDLSTPVIILNSRMENDRKRFTLAHELGHIIMHFEFPVSEYRDKETEANRFASEFLMPAKYIKQSLFNLRPSSLGSLKQYWLTSKASIIRRAKDLGCIDSNRYTYLNIELSRNGEKKKEKGTVFIDEPKLFSKGIDLHTNELEYSFSELAEAFQLPLDVVKKYCLKQKGDRGKLRVVL